MIEFEEGQEDFESERIITLTQPLLDRWDGGGVVLLGLL